MRVFVTGATGFVGSAVVPELLRGGHRVTGLARSEHAAQAIRAMGAEPVAGSLDELDSLRGGAQDCDGVVHLAFAHDFSQYAAAGDKDKTAVEALAGVLEGSGRPLVVTSATAVLPPGTVGGEQDRPDPFSPSAPRVASEQVALSAAARRVRTSVVRLPLSVHGAGDHQFVPAMIDIARRSGISAYVGDGAQRWPAVRRFDAARLFGRALEAALPGAVLHAVAEEAIPIRAIAEVIGKHLDIPVASLSPAAADRHFGWLAAFVALDAPVSSALTRRELDWQPQGPGLLEDLTSGSYFTGHTDNGPLHENS